MPRIRSNLYREICRAEDALKKLTEKSAAMDAGKGALKDLVSKVTIPTTYNLDLHNFTSK